MQESTTEVAPPIIESGTQILDEPFEWDSYRLQGEQLVITCAPDKTFWLYSEVI